MVDIFLEGDTMEIPEGMARMEAFTAAVSRARKNESDAKTIERAEFFLKFLMASKAPRGERGLSNAVQ